MTTNGKIYIALGDANLILRMDSQTQIVESLASELEGNDKYLSGVLNGKICFAPYNARRVVSHDASIWLEAY